MHKNTTPFQFTIIDKMRLLRLLVLTVRSILSSRLHNILSPFQPKLFYDSEHLIGHFMYKIQCYLSVQIFTGWDCICMSI